MITSNGCWVACVHNGTQSQVAPIHADKLQYWLGRVVVDGGTHTGDLSLLLLLLLFSGLTSDVRRMGRFGKDLDDWFASSQRQWLPLLLQQDDEEEQEQQEENEPPLQAPQLLQLLELSWLSSSSVKSSSGGGTMAPPIPACNCGVERTNSCWALLLGVEEEEKEDERIPCPAAWSVTRTKLGVASNERKVSMVED